jgi:hypothetical protein
MRRRVGIIPRRGGPIRLSRWIWSHKFIPRRYGIERTSTRIRRTRRSAHLPIPPLDRQRSHRSRRQQRQRRHGIKIRFFLRRIPHLLPGTRTFHPLHQLRTTPQKTLVIIRRSIGSLPSQSFKSPSVDLSDETLVSRLSKVLRTDFFHKVFFVEDLPRTAVGHPGDGVGELGIA